MNELDGKVAIVTGAGRGIGRATAIELARLGASVVVNDIGTSTAGVGRDASTAQAVASEITAAGGSALANTDSVSDFEAAGRIIGAAVEAFGSVDILVNDPRSMFATPLEEIGVDEWDAVQTRNAKAPFLLSQQVLPRMAKAEYGRVVNMISELAERGMINGSAFSASQAAVLALTRSLAVEWSRFNIRINAIGTGLMDTEGQTLEAQQEELVVRYTPLRRKGNPGDIGPLLVYLCSEFCDYSTGQVVYIDGGLNAHP